jgi:hypothetical protein
MRRARTIVAIYMRGSDIIGQCANAQLPSIHDRRRLSSGEGCLRTSTVKKKEKLVLCIVRYAVRGGWPLHFLISFTRVFDLLSLDLGPVVQHVLYT